AMSKVYHAFVMKRKMAGTVWMLLTSAKTAGMHLDVTQHWISTAQHALQVFKEMDFNV
ncbi:mucin-like protein, partial [Biomphalaria pfeifferi]